MILSISLISGNCSFVLFEEVDLSPLEAGTPDARCRGTPEPLCITLRFSIALAGSFAEFSLISVPICDKPWLTFRSVGPVVQALLPLELGLFVISPIL